MFDLLTHSPILFFFFFNDTATTEIYTLSLHDALPICFLEQLVERTEAVVALVESRAATLQRLLDHRAPDPVLDRKSTRLNSSHLVISYAVFCLKKKKNHAVDTHRFTQLALGARRLACL